MYELQERQCRASLRLLSQAGYIHFIEDPDSRSRVNVLCTREELYDIRDISPIAEKVLAATLRAYTGLFSDYVYVVESEIAAALKISENNVYDAFLELSRKKIVSYIPHSGLPMIYFPTSREETSSLLIGKDIYEKRKEAMTLRIEAMLDYTFSPNGCRVERMLKYFGETDSGECGKCDICRESKKRHDKSRGDAAAMVQRVWEYLKSQPHGCTLPLIERRCGTDTAATAAALQFLCNEGYAVCENNMYHLK